VRAVGREDGTEVGTAVGNGHSAIAVLGAAALAFVAWQRRQSRMSRAEA
jgi:hypothetical protein